ncbi:AT-hook motif nuclear-localized protein 10 [Andrographis paniculata]|uniref:AT-hook motif nuclear-localized protein 10 n=1 Tax=Andrographis paniculata TaxID=175694 RepID=UPI0021E875D5|nr:AT-hook motif nuclear-localized protein 10 [Andrographis paniculata]
MSDSGGGGGGMASLDSFALGPSSQNPAASQSQIDQQMCVPYTMGSPHYQSISGGAAVVKHGMNSNSGEQKRKRGRPRKYGTDGSMSMAMVAAQSHNFSPQAQAQAQAGSMGLSVSLPTATGKKRGRPPGSSNKKKQIEATGSTGIGFIPHVINVKAGEDVSSKIMAFSQNGPRTVCILSANGTVSNVTLRQAATSGGTATYEGRFDILSLSGSFMLSEVAGQRSRTGGLSTTLAGPDGRVFGGCVAGLLIAASPVQVIVGSFIAADGQQKEGKTGGGKYMEPLSKGSSSPTYSGSSGGGGGGVSPLNLSSGVCNNNSHPHTHTHTQIMPGMPWK